MGEAGVTLRVAGLALVCGLAACSSTPSYPTTTPPSPPPPTVQVPAPQPAPVAPRSPAPAPPPQASAHDQCGAAEMQRLVGRPRTEIPVPVDPSRQRVACTSCPVTQDYNPARLNFFFDADTGIIKQVRCG